MIEYILIVSACVAVGLGCEWILTRKKAPPTQRKKWPEDIE